MSIAGKWNVTMNTPVGTMKFSWDFAQESAGWRGRMIGQGMVKDSDLRDIHVDGDKVSFATTTQSPLGALELEFAGTAAGDSLPGVCKTSYGEFAFSAARA
jgi:hypothetical protein